MEFAIAFLALGRCSTREEGSTLLAGVARKSEALCSVTGQRRWGSERPTRGMPKELSKQLTENGRIHRVEGEWVWEESEEVLQDEKQTEIGAAFVYFAVARAPLLPLRRLATCLHCTFFHTIVFPMGFKTRYGR